MQTPIVWLGHQLIEIKHMATVKVFHKHREICRETPKETTHVATVVTHHKGTEALEYAYRVTQNEVGVKNWPDIHWTQGGNGILFGLDVTEINCEKQRETTVGDMMVIEDEHRNFEIYNVAMFRDHPTGFEKIK